MDSKKIFTQEVPELDKLSERANVAYYVSAGLDFRPVTFLTDHNTTRLSNIENLSFDVPELLIYSCLGPGLDEFFSSLHQGQVLHGDVHTKIRVRAFRRLKIRKDINLTLDKTRVLCDYDKWEQSKGSDAYLLKLEVTGLDSKTREPYYDTLEVLYFHHENIDTLHKLVLPYFNVDYLIVTREGCGFGGCKKSTVTHIYEENYPDFLRSKGFYPRYAILFNDFTHTLFEEAVKEVEDISFRSNYGQYIWGKEMVGSTIYKINYTSR